LLRFFESSSP